MITDMALVILCLRLKVQHLAKTQRVLGPGRHVGYLALIRLFQRLTQLQTCILSCCTQARAS